MERTLSVERLFTLGDYKNIKFGNTLTGIPEEIANNDKAIELLFLQQFISCEIAYRRYVEMLEHISEDLSVVRGGKKIADPEAVIQFLQEERTKTFSELYDEIKKAKTDESVNK